MSLFKNLGPYQIVRRLGRGGMGEVYLAIDTRRLESDPDREVALKVLWRDLERDNPGGLEAERRGAMLQARLYAVDQRIVMVNDFGDEGDAFFVDMEYIRGYDLAELMAKEGRMHPKVAAAIALELLDILSNVHQAVFEFEGKEQRGVVHGDIKPRNVRVDGQNRLRLLDFGIAKALTATRKLTRNEFGSVNYSSPERLDTGEVDIQSDLWAVGVMLYEMISGTLPFGGDSTARLEQAIMARVAPRPLGAEIPASLRQVVLKSLSGKVESRYPSASAFRDALAGAIQDMERPGASVQERPTAAPESSAPGESTRRTQDRLEPVPRGGGMPVQEGTQNPLLNQGIPEVEPRALAPRDAYAEASLAQTPPPSVPQQHRPPRAVRRHFGLSPARALGVFVLLVVLYLGYGIVTGLGQVEALTQQLQGRSLGCDRGWWEYENLGWAATLADKGPLENALAGACEQEADTILGRYRTEDPKLVKADWERANRASRHLLALNSSPRFDAWETYTRGHLERIDKRFDSARTLYDKAASLEPTFCDPFLALIHMYTYNQANYTELVNAVTAARARECKLGRRQEVQLADAQKAEAERMLKTDSPTQSLDERQTNLENLRVLLEASLQVYQRYPGLGQSRKLALDCKKKLADVDKRLTEVKTQKEWASRRAIPWPW